MCTAIIAAAVVTLTCPEPLPSVTVAAQTLQRSIPAFVLPRRYYGPSVGSTAYRGPVTLDSWVTPTKPLAPPFVHRDLSQVPVVGVINLGK